MSAKLPDDNDLLLMHGHAGYDPIGDTVPFEPEEMFNESLMGSGQGSGTGEPRFDNDGNELDPQDKDEPSEQASQDAHRPPIAVRLVHLIDPKTLLCDERGDGYVHLVRDHCRELLRLRGKTFRAHLAEQLFTIEECIPGGDAISAALQVLEAKARRQQRVTLWNRVARGPDGAVWLDLGDAQWRAVRIDADGWQVVAEPPPLFRRFAHQAPLPEPQRGGDLRQFLAFLNVASEADAVLLLSSTVAALVPDIPQAALILHGPQGSAKTTAGRLRRSLIDPSAAPTVIVRRDVGELVQALDHHYMPLLDNLNTLPDWMSDILCQAATGGGFVKRELYSDTDDVLFVFRRPLILTGVNIPATAPDLLDRSLLIRLERIAPEARREEAALLREFEMSRPTLLGGLLDALSGAMRIHRTVDGSRLPRLADFARWAAAAAEPLGYGASAFYRAMEENVARQVEEAIESDPVAQAIVFWISTRQQWEGTTSELLAELDRARSGKPAEAGWPKRAADLGRRLNLLAPVLANLGVRMEADSRGRGEGKRRTWRLVCAR